MIVWAKDVAEQVSPSRMMSNASIAPRFFSHRETKHVPKAGPVETLMRPLSFLYVEGPGEKESEAIPRPSANGGATPRKILPYLVPYPARAKEPSLRGKTFKTLTMSLTRARVQSLPPIQ